jgi:hypothetical protein
MNAQNRNWRFYSKVVLETFPASPDEYIRAVPGKEAQIAKVCETIAARKRGRWEPGTAFRLKPPDPDRIGKGFPRWTSRFLSVRTIAARMLDLHQKHGGVRRYYRDIYLSDGLSALVDEVVKDRGLPGIGKSTALSALRNMFGLDLVKPDVILQRIFHNLGWIDLGEDNADVFLKICQKVGIHRPAVVDHVFWVFGNTNGQESWGLTEQGCPGRYENGRFHCRKGSICFCSQHRI